VILLTTSRRPTRRIRTLCHDFVRSVPNIARINRGKLNLEGIAERAVELNANRIVVIDRWKAGPGKVKLFRIEQTGLVPVPPLMYVAGVRLRREFEAKTKQVRSLVVTMEPKNPTETVRIAEQLSDFLNLPRLPIDEAPTKYQASMHVSLDASRRIQITFMFLPQMVEIGPRITLSKVIWEVPP
jgi:rRNA maturation protein Rpf1